MADTSLLFASTAELGRLLRARKISSVELTKLSLEALETQGRALNAVAEVTGDLALRQARQADRELHAGAARGPLHGIPYGAKDLLATKGIPTRWGRAISSAGPASPSPWAPTRTASRLAWRSSARPTRKRRCWHWRWPSSARETEWHRWRPGS